MTTPILSLFDKSTQGICNREAIEMLESYLADAKAGRITCVAIAAVTVKREALTASSATDDRILLLGAISRLTGQLNALIEAESVPDGTGGAA